MSAKRQLLKYQLLTGQSATSSFNSAATNINYIDNVGIQVNLVSGTPSGTFTIQVSADYYQDDQGNIVIPGTWVTLQSPPGTNVAQAVTAGNPTSIYFDLNQLSSPWVRLAYTASSGTGTFNAYITGKTLS